MKRLLVVVLVALAGCDFRGSMAPGAKTVGQEVIVYHPTERTADSWLESPVDGQLLACHTPVGTRAVWLGSGLTIPGKPGVYERVRFSSDGVSALAYLPAANLRPVPR